jgi:hypothetical protein
MNIILSNLHLQNFQGSELVTIELAEHYAALGHDVTVYSPLIAPPLLPTIQHREKITLTMKVPDNLTEYDLVWSHHGLLLDEINRKTKRRSQVIISNHMSSYVDVEYPRYAPSAVDFIFANSAETRAVMPIEHQQNCELFQNPAPACTRGHGLSRAKPMGLSISNHRPQELVSFMIEHQTEIDFELFGMKTPNYTRITPDVLRETNCDFVICNGKSTQAAMIAELPIFIFDTYKGCGWLTEENFTTAEWHNFSGRGFSVAANLKDILDFNSHAPIELGERRWRFQLDMWLEKRGLI